MNNDFCNSSFVSPDERILITGAAGFIGSRVVEGLLDRGFRNLSVLHDRRARWPGFKMQ